MPTTQDSVTRQHAWLITKKLWIQLPLLLPLQIRLTQKLRIESQSATNISYRNRDLERKGWAKSCIENIGIMCHSHSLVIARACQVRSRQFESVMTHHRPAKWEKLVWIPSSAPIFIQLRAGEWCVKGRKMRYAKPEMEEPRIPQTRGSSRLQSSRWERGTKSLSKDMGKN